MRCSRALRRFTLPVVSLLAFISPMAQAQAQSPDSGDTAWLLVATAFVLMMIIPGLALFYGGLVRSKNILSVLMQCFAITALVSLLWVFYGYSLAFDTTGMRSEEHTSELQSLMRNSYAVF